MADSLTELTAAIVGRYVEANAIAAADLASLIRTTYAALSEAVHPAAPPADPLVKPTAAQIRKSMRADALISFIDGKPYKMLKRHLTTYGLTAKTYRERYGLPFDYPMTAPTYSAARSELALKIGLGRRAAPDATAAAPSAPRPAPAKRSAPEGEKAGPGARVPKAVGSPKAMGRHRAP